MTAYNLSSKPFTLGRWPESYVTHGWRESALGRGHSFTAEYLLAWHEGAPGFPALQEGRTKLAFMFSSPSLEQQVWSHRQEVNQWRKLNHLMILLLCHPTCGSRTP